VIRTRVGYAGGSTADPTYRRIGDHAETVEVDYDPSVIGYADLLTLFWRGHDPRRPAFSTQYRSAVFYRTDDERRLAEESKSAIEGVLGGVRTAIEPLDRFYRAEDYHQKYRLRSSRTIMSAFRRLFPDDRDFVDSTAAARVNGWLDGCGDADGIERDLPRLGLGEEALAELRELLGERARRGGYVAR